VCGLHAEKTGRRRRKSTRREKEGGAKLSFERETGYRFAVPVDPEARRPGLVFRGEGEKGKKKRKKGGKGKKSER